MWHIQRHIFVIFELTSREYIANISSVEASLGAIKNFQDQSQRQVAAIVLKKSVTEHYQEIKDSDLATLRQQLIESYFAE